jgi:hypothetical protein
VIVCQPLPSLRCLYQSFPSAAARWKSGGLLTTVLRKPPVLVRFARHSEPVTHLRRAVGAMPDSELGQWKIQIRTKASELGPSSGLGQFEHLWEMKDVGEMLEAWEKARETARAVRGSGGSHVLASP